MGLNRVGKAKMIGRGDSIAVADTDTENAAPEVMQCLPVIQDKGDQIRRMELETMLKGQHE